MRGISTPPTFEDHWICEYWQPSAQDWVVADAQLDAAHIQHLSIAFDPVALPGDAFLFPWQVWTRRRDTPQAFDAFGHGDAVGAWFVRVSLARDLLALTKHEVSAWDTWRDHKPRHKVLTPEDMALCDKLAEAGRVLSTSRHVDIDSLEVLIADLETPPWQD